MKGDHAGRKHKGVKEGIHAPSQQTIVQPKLELTTPGDSYEREADRMADFVMRKAYSGLPTEMPSTSSVLPPLISRRTSSSTSGVAVDSATESGIHTSRGGGHPMPTALRSQMESGFETDFSRVRLHTGSAAEAMSNDLSAKAFTYGNDIYFNRGQYSPDTTAGQHLIAHELTHVVQQNGKVGREEVDEKKSTGLEEYLKENFIHVEQTKKTGDIKFNAKGKYNLSERKKIIDCDVYIAEAISYLEKDYDRKTLENRLDPVFHVEMIFKPTEEENGFITKFTINILEKDPRNSSKKTKAPAQSKLKTKASAQSKQEIIDKDFERNREKLEEDGYIFVKEIKDIDIRDQQIKRIKELKRHIENNYKGKIMKEISEKNNRDAKVLNLNNGVYYILIFGDSIGKPSHAAMVFKKDEDKWHLLDNDHTEPLNGDNYDENMINDAINKVRKLHKDKNGNDILHFCDYYNKTGVKKTKKWNR